MCTYRTRVMVKPCAATLNGNEYDAVGNFLRLHHQATNGNWTRSYAYNEPSLLEPVKNNNRLSSATIGAVNPITETYAHDEHGNMIAMPHLSRMQWNFKDQLSTTSRQVVNNGMPETTYYVYDAAGQRTRKVTERQNGTRKSERTYLGGFEVYREYDSNGTGVTLERETLHVMDDKQRIVLVETRTQGNDGSPAQLLRYQFSNHLGSASLELDHLGRIISFEEYYPYGSTSYQAMRIAANVSLKRYRYTGLERDEESGLNYHGARYYAAWVERWMSCDSSGIEAGINLYTFSRNNPVIFVDLSGHDSTLSGGQWGVENGVDMGGTLDEFGSYWYGDETGNTWLWKEPEKSWELVSGPSDAIQVVGKQPTINFEGPSWVLPMLGHTEDRGMWPAWTEGPGLFERFGNHMKLARALDNGDYDAPIVKKQNYSEEDLRAIDRSVTFNHVSDTIAELTWAPEKAVAAWTVEGVVEGTKAAEAAVAGAEPIKAAKPVSSSERSFVAAALEGRQQGLERVESALSTLRQASDEVEVTALLKVNQKEFWGLNKQWTTEALFKDMGQMWQHAELDALGQAYTQTATMGKDAEMWVSECLCGGSCLGARFGGNVPKAMEQMGLKSLLIHTPTETFMLEPGKAVMFWLAFPH